MNNIQDTFSVGTWPRYNIGTYGQNLSSVRNVNFLLFCRHSSTNIAVSRQRLGEIFIEIRDKAAMPANITARYHATSVYHSNPSVIPDAKSAHSPLTHSDDVQVSNVVTPTEPPATALLSDQKTQKASSVLANLATLCQPTGMAIRWLTVQRRVFNLL